MIDLLRRRRLSWYGHVKRREDDHASVLRSALEMEMDGVRLRGRSRKTWKQCVAENMRAMNIIEDTALNRREREGLIKRPTLKPIACVHLAVNGYLL